MGAVSAGGASTTDRRAVEATKAYAPGGDLLVAMALRVHERIRRRPHQTRRELLICKEAEDVDDGHVNECMMLSDRMNVEVPPLHHQDTKRH